jgi:diacylglycerol kinase family enzyme
MRKAIFLYNPASGRPARRMAKINAAAAVLRQGGVEVQIEALRGAAEAPEQARAVAMAGFDAIIACGGDGTLHDLAQGLVGISSSAALGVLPLGTGNVLAKNQRLSLDPAQAAQALLHAEPRRIAVGKIEFTSDEGSSTRSRYFLLNAGAGLDAIGIYEAAASKPRLGELAYYLTGIRLMFSYAFPMFEVEWRDAESGAQRREQVSQCAAFRVPTLGGLAGALTPAAGLERDDLQLILFKTRSRRKLFHYSLRHVMRAPIATPEVELVFARELACTALGDKPIYVQADGEWLGRLPARISMVQDAITLLFPPSFRQRCVQALRC